MSKAILFLAGGASQRFDGDKRFVALPSGQNLFERARGIAEDAGLKALFAVNASAMQRLVSTSFAAACYEVKSADEGMGASISESVAHYADDCDSLLLCPLDLPLLQASTIQRVADLASQQAIVQPECKGRLGHPVAFGAVYFHQLLTLQGDQGAKAIIQRNADQLVKVMVEDPGIYEDLDTADDYLKLFGQPLPVT